MVDVGADMRELAEESLVLDAEEGTLEQLEWTSDGQENQDTRPSPFITPKTQ